MLIVRKVQRPPTKKLANAEEMLLDDEDILESTPAASATFPVASTRQDLEESVPTSVNDLVEVLARISHVSLTPRLRGAVEWAELGEQEAWLVSVIGAGLTVEAILQTSPLDEEGTLRVLAKLITDRVITLD